MHNRSKWYVGRLVTIAGLSGLLGVLALAIFAYAAPAVVGLYDVDCTTPKTEFAQGADTICAKVAGGVASSAYYAEYWGPTTDNGSTLERKYQNGPLTTDGAGAVSDSQASAGTDTLGTWEQRYLYNPNYGNPQYIDIISPAPGQAAYANATAVTYSFRIVDRDGNPVLTDHASDVRIELRRNSSRIFRENPTASNGWSFNTGNGVYSKTDSSRSDSLMEVRITGRSSWGLDGTLESGDSFVMNNVDRRYMFANIGNYGVVATDCYRIEPDYALNGYQVSVPGTTSLNYNFYFKLYDYNGSEITSPTGVTWSTLSAEGCGTGNVVTGTTPAYNGTHWYTTFGLPAPDKYGVFIRVTTGAMSPRSWQIVNFTASQNFSILQATQPAPGDITWGSAVPSDNRVTLDWTLPATNETGIVVFRNTSSMVIPPVDGNTYTVDTSYGKYNVVYNALGTSHVDGNPCVPSQRLVNGRTYYYKAYAYNADNIYAPGVQTSAVPLDVTAPGVVTGITATQLDRKIRLNWTNPSDCDFKGVTIRYSTTSFPTSRTGADGSTLAGVKLGGTPGGADTFTQQSLVNGTPYYYTIWSHDDETTRNWSGGSSPAAYVAPADTEAPATISDLAIKAGTTGAFDITVEWTSPADSGIDPLSGNASKYFIKYYNQPIDAANWDLAWAPGGEWLPQPVAVGTLQSYKITGLSPSHDYYFAIRTIDEVDNMSGVSNNPTETTLCNAEISACDQCHQMPPTDGLPGQHPRGTGNIGKHSLPIHAGAGEAEVCNVCHADGNVWRNNTTLYGFTHQDYKIDVNGPGMIGNKAERDTLTGGTFNMYTEIIYKFQGYSTGVAYKQMTGRCSNTYCHGGVLDSPRWGIDEMVCGESCHETPPATGKHVKHYHPGMHYINYAPNGTVVSGYTNNDGSAWAGGSSWSGTYSTGDNGPQQYPSGTGNADPRYASYIASSNSTSTINLPAGDWFITVCVGDSSIHVANQTVKISGNGGDSGTWDTIVNNWGWENGKAFLKIVDHPFQVTGGNNLQIRIGNGLDETRLNYVIVNSTPEAPKTNNTILSNTATEYGFSCGKCHTADSSQAGHTGHVNTAYQAQFRDSELSFDGLSFPKNPLGNYSAIFDAVSSYRDGQGYFYTLGSQCANTYCHGNDPSSPIANSGGSNTIPTWNGGYVDVEGASLCGACHEAGYADTTPNSTMSTGSHDEHASVDKAYRFDCYKCHNHTVGPKDGGTGIIPITDKTYHVNGDVNAEFDLNDNTMKFGRYSTSQQTCYEVYCHSNGLLENNSPYWATEYAEPVWGSGSKTCNYCHGTSTTDGHPDYANTSTTPNSHMVHREENGIGCSTCHHDTTRDNGLSIYTTYQPTLHVNGSTDLHFDPVVVGGAANFNHSNLECTNTYCHGTTSPPKWGQEGSVFCGDCHGIAPNYGAHAKHSGGNYGNISTVNANNSIGGSYDFDCRFCHFSRTHGSGEIIPGVQSAEVNFNTIDVVNAYNNTGGVYTPGATVMQDGSNWNFSAGACSVKCHSDGRGGPPNDTMFNWTSASGSLNCSGCHGGAIGSRWGDISTGKHQKHTNATVYRKTCGDCHSITAIGNTLNNTANHVNGEVNVVLNGVWGGTFNQTNETCDGVQCHSNADPSAWNGAGSIFHVLVNWSSAVTSTCTTCHSDNYYPAGDGVRTAQQTLSHSHGMHLTGYAGRIGCTNCHNDTAATDTSLQATMPTSHNNGNKDVIYYTSFFNHTGSANGGNGYWGEWDAPTPGNCTVICHSDGNGGDPVWFPNWSTASGSYGCNACHGDKNSLVSGSHEAHVKTNNIACASCHRLTAGGSVGTPFINASGHSAKHVDGTKDVVIAMANQISGTTVYSGGVCNDTTCHGAGNSPAWGTIATCADCHATTSAELNDFTYGNAQKATVNSDEYTGSGHGRTTPYTYSGNAGANRACEDCHTKLVAHDTATNPFRLLSSATIKPSQPDTLCLSCHTNMGAHDYAHVQLDNNWSFTPKCVDCHDPHGDMGGITTAEFNGAMIQGTVANSGSGTFGAPSGTPQAVDFPANYASAQALTAYNWSSFVVTTGQANKGICRVCHTAGTTQYFTTTAFDGAHNSDQGKCTTCHSHESGFKPSACNACHGYPPNVSDNKQDNVGAVGAHDKHINYGADCAACHGHNGSGGQHNESAVLGGYSSLLTNGNVDMDMSGSASFKGGLQSYSGISGSWSPNKYCGNVGCHYGTSRDWDCQP